MALRRRPPLRFRSFRGPRMQQPQRGRFLRSSPRRASSFADLQTALREHPDLMKEHFFTEVPVDEHKFTALHAAFHSDAVLRLRAQGRRGRAPASGDPARRRRRLDVPSHDDRGRRERQPDLRRPLLVARCRSSRRCAASVVEVEARRGATVNYISLQEWGAQRPSLPDPALHRSPRHDRAKPRGQSRHRPSPGPRSSRCLVARARSPRCSASTSPIATSTSRSARCNRTTLRTRRRTSSTRELSRRSHAPSTRD